MTSCPRIIIDGVDQTFTGTTITLGDDVKIIFSTDGNTFLVYNSAINKLDLTVNNVLRERWR